VNPSLRCARALCGTALVAVTLVIFSPSHASAALLSLIDDNSQADFDTATPSNNYNWLVDNTDRLAQQAFWYRIGNAGPESSVHTLPIGVQGTSDANFDGNPDTLFVRYNGAGFRIETRYTLDGGTPGSGESDMGEQISIINLATRHSTSTSSNTPTSTSPPPTRSSSPTPMRSNRPAVGRRWWKPS
jgi:hypothetical protein